MWSKIYDGLLYTEVRSIVAKNRTGKETSKVMNLVIDSYCELTGAECYQNPRYIGATNRLFALLKTPDEMNAVASTLSDFILFA